MSCYSGLIFNVAGTLAMANKGDPNSGGSQWFINMVNNQHLDWWRHDLSASAHPVFAKVVEGWGVVRRISKTLPGGGHVIVIAFFHHCERCLCVDGMVRDLELDVFYPPLTVIN